MNYNRIILLLMCIVLPLLSFGKDDAQVSLIKGNQQYAKSQYTAAQATYQQLLDEGYQSVALYFNMGNACYKNGDIPSALLYYEKAHKLAPGDDDINFNIQFANLKTTDKVEEAPEFFLTKWWKGFILMFSMGALSVLSIVLILLASAMLIAYLFTKSVSIKRSSFYIATGLLCFGFITIFMANRQADYFDNHHQAIIFSNSVNVKSSPGSAARTLFVLHEGTKVDVLESNSSYTKIKLANGNEGWISAGDAKAI